jgi:hypothetical protein
MSTTTLSVQQVRGQLSAEDVRLKRLWNALPDHPISEETAFELIVAAGGRMVGDDAWASGMLTILRGMGAVSVTHEGIRRSDEFPILPDLIPGSDAYNELRDRERAEAREREIANENTTARHNFEHSPLGRQQRELKELVDRRVDELLTPRVAELVDAAVEERIETLMRRLEPEAVKRAREKLGSAA